jgi:hypothetical protein
MDIKTANKQINVDSYRQKLNHEAYDDIKSSLKISKFEFTPLLGGFTYFFRIQSVINMHRKTEVSKDMRKATVVILLYSFFGLLFIPMSFVTILFHKIFKKALADYEKNSSSTL